MPAAFSDVLRSTRGAAPGRARGGAGRRHAGDRHPERRTSGCPAIRSGFRHDYLPLGDDKQWLGYRADPGADLQAGTRSSRPRTAAACGRPLVRPAGSAVGWTSTTWRVRVPRLWHGHQLGRRLARGRAQVSPAPRPDSGWIKVQGYCHQLGVRFTTTSVPTPTRRRACGERATPSPTARSTASTRTTSATTSSSRATPLTTTASTGSSSPGAATATSCATTPPTPTLGHGFMIDNGRSAASATAQARIDPSDDNRVTGNVAYDNAGSGVEIEGGTGNVVADNHLVAQRRRGARKGQGHGLGHRQRDRRQRSLRGARPRPGSAGGDRGQPRHRVLGGDQPRRGEQRDDGGKTRRPTSRHHWSSAGWPNATRRGSTGWGSSCTGTRCWCCGC